MRFQKLSIVVVLAAVWGCAGNDAVNIGDDQKTPKAKTGELLSDYAATWDGYAEAHPFRSGSDRVRIELDDEGKGHVVFGEGTPPAPTTDPANSPFEFTDNGGIVGIDGDWIEGFEYTVQHAEVRERRIQLAFSGMEIFKAWCDLQVPLRDTSESADAPEYACVPHFDGWRRDHGRCWGTDPQTGEDVEVNCMNLLLCGEPSCTCTADGCTIPSLSSSSTTGSGGALDAVLDDGGATLVGTLVLADGVNAPMSVTVRMQRQ